MGVPWETGAKTKDLSAVLRWKILYLNISIFWDQVVVTTNVYVSMSADSGIHGTSGIVPQWNKWRCHKIKIRVHRPSGCRAGFVLRWSGSLAFEWSSILLVD